MIQQRLVLIATASLVCCASVLRAQIDTASIGGAEGNAAYSEAPSIGEEALSREPALHDVNDSLQLLPCYDLYCDWDTRTIFPASGEHGRDGTAQLQLSTQACDHALPVCGTLNSDFGPRRGRMHYGVDLDLETGDAVVAAFEGIVRISRYDRTFGHVIVVRHWNGLETLYAHLSERKVEMGDALVAGDTLGLGGSTGRSTGSHLHFEVRYLGRPIDPKFIFDLEDGTLKTTTLQVNNGSFGALSGARSYHLVRRGESLSAIARRYGTNVQQLCRLNAISSRGTLHVGQRIRYR